MPYIPLTEEQFKKARLQFSLEEIVAFEQKRKQEMGGLARPETYGALFPATGQENPFMAGLKSLGNVPSSAFNLVSGVAGIAKSPVQTAKGFGKAVIGAGERVGREILERTPLANRVAQVQESQNEQVFSALASSLKERYGSLENLQKTAINDPFGFGTDIAGILGGGATLLGKGAQASKLVSAVAKPITKTVSRAVEGTGTALGRTGRFGVSQATGLEPETISTIAREPQAFSRSAQSGTSRMTLGQEVQTAIDSRLGDLSELGEGYQMIRETLRPVFLEPNWFESKLKDFKLTLQDGNIIANTTSRTRNPADITALQRIYDSWGGKTSLTPEEFLNFRSDLAELAKFDRVSGKTKVSEEIAKDLRSAINTKREQIPGLKELDAQYSPEVELLNKVKREYLTSQGDLKDGAASKIANLTGKGKDQVLGRIEQITPGITEKIKVLKAVEDIERASGLKVGTYARAGAVIGGAATGNMPLIVAAILAQPEIAVPLIRGYGMTRAKIAPILNALRQEIGAINNFQVGSRVSEYLKNPKVGLSIEDVSKQVYQGEKNLTTKVLDRLKGKSTVSKQFISDLTNSADLKQPERDLIRKVLEESTDSSPFTQEARKYKTAEVINKWTPQQMGMFEDAIKNAKKLGAPITKDGNIVLYHGTATGRAPKVGENWRVGSYFTTDYATAKQYSMQGSGGKPLVLKVEIPAEKVFSATSKDSYWTLNEETPIKYAK